MGSRYRSRSDNSSSSPSEEACVSAGCGVGVANRHARRFKLSTTGRMIRQAATEAAGDTDLRLPATRHCDWETGRGFQDAVGWNCGQAHSLAWSAKDLVTRTTHAYQVGQGVENSGRRKDGRYPEVLTISCFISSRLPKHSSSDIPSKGNPRAMVHMLDWHTHTERDLWIALLHGHGPRGRKPET